MEKLELGLARLALTSLGILALAAPTAQAAASIIHAGRDAAAARAPRARGGASGYFGAVATMAGGTTATSGRAGGTCTSAAATSGPRVAGSGTMITTIGMTANGTRTAELLAMLTLASPRRAWLTHRRRSRRGWSSPGRRPWSSPFAPLRWCSRWGRTWIVSAYSLIVRGRGTSQQRQRRVLTVLDGQTVLTLKRLDRQSFQTGFFEK